MRRYIKTNLIKSYIKQTSTRSKGYGIIKEISKWLIIHRAVEKVLIVQLDDFINKGKALPI